jgi:hypothetical protein
LVKDRLHAVPFAGDGSLLSFVEEACSDRVPWREVKQGANLRERLRQAEADREGTLVVADLETLRDPLYAGLVSDVAEGLGRHAALLVLRNEQGPPSADADAQVAITMRGAFGNAVDRALVRDWTTIRTADAFRRKLNEATTKLRQALVAEDPPRRVEDAALAADAAARGVPIDELSTLAGPGTVQP